VCVCVCPRAYLQNGWNELRDSFSTDDSIFLPIKQYISKQQVHSSGPCNAF